MAVKSLAQSSLKTASSTNSMLAGYEGNQFHHLETVRLGGNAATVGFTNLARYSDYQHLQLRIVTRATGNNDVDQTRYRINNDSTAGRYASHFLRGSGSSVISSSNANLTYGRLFDSSCGQSGNGNFAAVVVDVLDPFDVTKNTTLRALSGMTSGSGVFLFSSAYLSTTAVDQFSFYSPQGESFVSGTRFSLYGIKARA
jgi:hypothetical protein